MSEVQTVVSVFLGTDPIAGGRALRDLVAMGDAGEDALFAKPIQLGLAQTRRRWLRYVATRPDSVTERLFERLIKQDQFEDGWSAAYLCAGLPQRRSFRDRLYTLMTQNFSQSGYYDFVARYMAWGASGGDAGTLWHIVKDDTFKWEKLVTFAFRAACVSCARITDGLWALEQFITHQHEDYVGLVEIPNDPLHGISHEAVEANEIALAANYTFSEWCRGELADKLLRSWSLQSHWRIREFGAHILSTFGFQRTLGPVVAWLGREQIKLVRNHLLHALERMRTPAAANALVDYYLRNGEGGDYVAKAAWRATDRASAIRALNRVAADSETSRAEVLVSLARLGKQHPSVVETLDAQMPYARLNAALALGYLGDEAAVPRLVSMQAEASGALERIALAAALALMKQPDAALNLRSQLTLPKSTGQDLMNADMFLMHRYLQEAVLDGLAAGGEETREALTIWRAEFEPFDPVAESVTTIVARTPGAGGRLNTIAPPSPIGGVGATPLKVFVSYSHRDEKMRKKLAQHLATLVNEGVIRIWHDREIEAGADWEGTIDQEISDADVVLLLVSAEFLASPYCRQELVRALERRSVSKTIVVPIILRHCDWQSVFNSKDYKTQALPRDDRPVSGGRWPNQDAAFAEIVKELRRLVAPIH